MTGVSVGGVVGCWLVFCNVRDIRNIYIYIYIYRIYRFYQFGFALDS